MLTSIFMFRKGSVVILELNATENLLKSNRRFVSHEHQGWNITCMTWSDNSHKLFVGDDGGKVSVCNMAVQTVILLLNPSNCKLRFVWTLLWKNGYLFQAKKLFDDTATVIKTEHSIVQLDFFNNNLLVSNFAKCFLCDVLKYELNSRQSVLETRSRWIINIKNFISFRFFIGNAFPRLEVNLGKGSTVPVSSLKARTASSLIAPVLDHACGRWFSFRCFPSLPFNSLSHVKMNLDGPHPSMFTAYADASFF